MLRDIIRKQGNCLQNSKKLCHAPWFLAVLKCPPCPICQSNGLSLCVEQIHHHQLFLPRFSGFTRPSPMTRPAILQRAFSHNTAAAGQIITPYVHSMLCWRICASSRIKELRQDSLYWCPDLVLASSLQIVSVLPRFSATAVPWLPSFRQSPGISSSKLCLHLQISLKRHHKPTLKSLNRQVGVPWWSLRKRPRPILEFIWFCAISAALLPKQSAVWITSITLTGTRHLKTENLCHWKYGIIMDAFTKQGLKVVKPLQSFLAFCPVDTRKDICWLESRFQIGTWPDQQWLSW